MGSCFTKPFFLLDRDIIHDVTPISFFCAVCLARNNKTDTPSDLPSGTNTQDSLEELNDAMYFQHRDNKQSKEKEDPLVEEYLGPRPRRRATRQVRQVGGRRRRLLWLELIRAR